MLQMTLSRFLTHGWHMWGRRKPRQRVARKMKICQQASSHYTSQVWLLNYSPKHGQTARAQKRKEVTQGWWEQPAYKNFLKKFRSQAHQGEYSEHFGDRRHIWSHICSLRKKLKSHASLFCARIGVIGLVYLLHTWASLWVARHLCWVMSPEYFSDL